MSWVRLGGGDFGLIRLGLDTSVGFVVKILVGFVELQKFTTELMNQRMKNDARPKTKSVMSNCNSKPHPNS